MSSADIWLSANQLAGLPGWPSTRRRAKVKAERDNLPSRTKKTSGGGKEYHISGLQPEARAAILNAFGVQTSEQEEIAEPAIALLQREATNYQSPIINCRGMVATAPEAIALATPVAIAPTAITVIAAPSVVTTDHQPKTKAEARKDSKLWMLQQLNQYQQERGISYTLACEDFSKLYNERKIAIPDWVAASIKSTSRATLLRWFNNLKEGKFDALAGGYGNRKGDTKIDKVSAVKNLLPSAHVFDATNRKS